MTEAQHSATSFPETSSSSGRESNNEAGDFECNICFDLAQDPVITLCGHLYCWPCLYKWLRGHSQSHECPVCKALIEEEKLVPLYGRGKTPTDPRSKPVPGVEVPHRPAGQRPETAPPPPPEANGFGNPFSGLMGGFVPITTVNFSSFGVSAGFGGAFLPFFSLQFHGFPNPHGSSGGFNFNDGNPASSYEREAQPNRAASQAATLDDENLKKIFFVILCFVVLAFLTL